MEHEVVSDLAQLLQGCGNPTFSSPPHVQRSGIPRGPGMVNVGYALDVWPAMLDAPNDPRNVWPPITVLL